MSRAITFSPNSECGTKRRYATKRQAKLAGRWAETLLGGGRLVPYRCSWCGLFHCGHRPDPAAISDALAKAAKRHSHSEI